LKASAEAVVVPTCAGTALSMARNTLYPVAPDDPVQVTATWAVLDPSEATMAVGTVTLRQPASGLLAALSPAAVTVRTEYW